MDLEILIRTKYFNTLCHYKIDEKNVRIFSFSMKLKIIIFAHLKLIGPQDIEDILPGKLLYPIQINIPLFLGNL